MKKRSERETYDSFIKSNPQWEPHRDLIFAPPSEEELVENYPGVDREVASRCMERLSQFITRGAQYMMMRIEGESDRMAAMVALRKGPGLSTDDTFFHGMKPLYDQFESQKALDRVLDESKKRGFVPDKNSVYFPNLARFKGDPEAYVSRAQGRSYIKKLLEKRGWESDGAVKVKGREATSDPYDRKNRKLLGEDVISKYAGKMVEQDPSLKRISRQELREKVIEKHGPKD